jgi:hypothetical protein
MVLTMLGSMAMTGALAPQRASAQDVGDSVTVVDLDGNDVAVATFEDIIDPFEDFEPDPEPGLRFISVELTIENVGDDPIEINTSNIGVVDDAGIIYVDVDVTRTDNLDPLESGTLDAGDEISGGLEIGLPEESEVTQIVWLVGQGQLPTLFRDRSPIDEGDEVSLFNTDYEEEAIFIAEDVVDEFDDLADDVELNDGFKFVGVTVTIENTGEDDFIPEPDSIFLATTDGIFWAQDASLVRSDDSLDELEDLTDDPIAPGDSVTGFVGFGTADTAEIDYVFYLPSDSTRLIHLFDAETSGSGPDEEATPDEEENNGGLGPIGQKTPEAEETEEIDDPEPSGDDCEGAAEWADETIAGLNEWSAVFGDLDPNNLDPEQLRENAETIRDIADTQADSDFPPAVEELNDAIVAAYEDSAEALEMIAEGVETGDSALIGEGAQLITEVGTSFQDGEVAEILAETEEICPDISDL